MFTKNLQFGFFEHLIFPRNPHSIDIFREKGRKKQTVRAHSLREKAAEHKHAAALFCSVYCWVDLIDWRVFLSSASEALIASSVRRMMSST